MNILERKIKKDYISFAEKPVRDEEIIIAEKLKRFVSTYNSRDLTGFMDLFADNAIIESKSGMAGLKTLSKKEFEESTKNAFPFVDKIFLDDIIIRPETTDRVNTNMLFTVLLRGGRGESSQFHLGLERMGGDWLIVKNLYN